MSVKWTVRLDASRTPGEGWDDLAWVVAHHYRMFAQAVEFLGPYNAKQRGNQIYMPPSKEELRADIRQGRVNDFTYSAFINSLVTFCERTKGMRALPTPHPSVIHSIQLPRPAFSLEPAGDGTTMITVIGVEQPLFVKGLRRNDSTFIIIRPKTSKLGTASATKWEVLFFNETTAYQPEWTDTVVNPRYSGTYH